MNYSLFFDRKPKEVAHDLLGRYLAVTPNSKKSTRVNICEITEVGAYKGDLDLPSRNGMLYAPGKLFLMRYRGGILFNIATGREGEPACVEIRGARFGEGNVEGSGKIANLLGLDGRLDGHDFKEIFRLGGEPVAKRAIISLKGKSENCLGYFTFRRS